MVLKRAKEVKQTIEENGGKASIYKCNVSDFAACEAMIKDIVKEYGHLDILVNNAGITKDGLIMKMKEEDFDSVLNVNLKGTFNTIRHSARQMLKQRSGKIINISSVSGILGNVGQANYAASKAGVIGLTKTMARELGSRGITVNAIAPGFVDTEMTEVLSEEIRKMHVSRLSWDVSESLRILQIQQYFWHQTKQTILQDRSSA